MSDEQINENNLSEDDENHRESIFYDTLDDLENAKLIINDVTRGRSEKYFDGNEDFYADADYISVLIKTATDLMLTMTDENGIHLNIV